MAVKRASIVIQVRGGLQGAAEVDAVKESVEGLGDEVDDSTRSALLMHRAYQRLTAEVRKFARSNIVATATIRTQNTAMRALIVTAIAFGTMAMPLAVSGLGAATIATVAMLGAVVGLGAGIGLMAAGAVLRFKETADAAGSAAAELQAEAKGIRDQFAYATADGSDRLFGGISRGLRTINPLVSEFRNEFSAIGAAGGDAISSFFDRVLDAGPEIGSLLRQVPRALGPLSDLAATGMDVFLRLANVGMPLLIDGIEWLDRVTSRWVDSLTDARVAGALDTLHTAFDGIRNFVNGIADTLGPELVPAAADFAGMLERSAGPLGTIIGAVLAGFVQLAHGALPGLETAIAEIAPALQDIVDSGALKTLGSVFGTTFGAAATAIGAVVGELQRVGLLKPLILGVVAAFVAWKVATVALNVVMRANPILLIVSAIAALGVGVVYAYRRFAWFRNGVNAAWGALKDGWAWIRDHWPLLLSILTGPVGTAAIYIARHFDQIVAFIKGVPGRVGNAAKAVGSAIANGIKSGIVGAINWVIDQINWLIRRWNDIGGTLSKLPGVPDLTIGEIGHVGGGDGGTNGSNPGGFRGPGASGLAAGGSVLRSGLSWVGERGKELLSLPAGAKVLDHNRSMEAARTQRFPARLDGALAGALAPLFADISVQVDGREILRATDKVRLNDNARKGTG